MRTEIKKLPGSVVEAEIELSPEELRPYLLRAAEALTKERPIEGFRPGKVPYDEVKKRFGEHTIYERAAQLAVRTFAPQVITDNELKIVGRPEVSVYPHTKSRQGETPSESSQDSGVGVKKLAPGNPLMFSIKTAVIPEFKLPDFERIAQKILKTKTTPRVEPKEIDDAIQWLREERGQEKLVSRPAAKGDRVEIDFTASHADVEIGGGKSQNHPLIIGKGTMVPGFEEELVGMSPNDEKKFSLAIPDSHAEKSIAGKTLDFSVKMNQIKERILPELNDEFAKTLGNFDSLSALTENIKEGITEEKIIKERDRLRVAMADAIAQETSMEVPEVMVSNELEKMMSELKANLESMGLNYENYLTHVKKTEEILKRDWHVDAERRVKIALVLAGIANNKKIEPSAEEVEGEIKQFLAKFKTTPQAEKTIDPESLKTWARGTVRNEKVFQYLENL
ncbi:MAG: trigger factor [Candidatus Sungbacteria bacterium]|nr:trigger factor [Candidatus Sungbacteria bacterium]